MKTERLNCVIFTLCCVTFILQSVGYLSPAWFVREYSVHHGVKGFQLDGKTFMLFDAWFVDDEDAMSEVLSPTPSAEGAERKRRDIIKQKNPANDGVDSRQKDTDGVHSTNLNQNAVVDEDGKEGDADTIQDKINHMDTEIPDSGDQTKNDNSDNSSKFPMTDKKHFTTDSYPDKAHHAAGDDMFEDQIADTNVISPSKPIHGSDVATMGKARNLEMFMSQNRILHVSAGLWYGRACVNSRDILTGTDGVKGTEWCTMYIRTNGSTLDNQKDVFEFRIEASLGLAICLLGLLVASSACCSQPRQGTRMIFSLLCMFVSGAVMLVPVVHMIVQHQNLSGLFYRRRSMSRFMVHMYARHDLFDHWSVVLCGCGSIISVIGSILFMVIGCRHQKSEGNRYDMSMSEKGSVTRKSELPVNWARNNKITIPTSTLTIAETPDSLEAEDSDYHTITKDEDCPSVGTSLTQDEAADDDGASVEKGNGSDVIGPDDTGYDVMTNHVNEIDYFEHVLEDD